MRRIYKTILGLILFYPVITFSKCDNSNQKIYHYSFQDSVISFVLLNHNFLVSDIQNKNGEYLQSLLIQLNLPNNDRELNYLIELVNMNKNPYDFAMALTKDKN